MKRRQFLYLGAGATALSTVWAAMPARAAAGLEPRLLLDEPVVPKIVIREAVDDETRSRIRTAISTVVPPDRLEPSPSGAKAVEYIRSMNPGLQGEGYAYTAVRTSRTDAVANCYAGEPVQVTVDTWDLVETGLVACGVDPGANDVARSVWLKNC